MQLHFFTHLKHGFISFFISIIFFLPLIISAQSLPTNLWTDSTSTYLPKTNNWTNRVEVADLNGDGWVDIIFANGGDYARPGKADHNRVFLNQGPGKLFKEATEILGDSGDYARAIKVGFLNGDEWPDIVVANTFQTQSRLYFGTDNGQFKEVTATHLPQIKASFADVELGDIDQDGDLDLALVDWGPGINLFNKGGRTQLWLNDGKGKFTDVTAQRMPDILVQFSWDIEFVDYDNDFDLDLIISCRRCAEGLVFRNDSLGYFKVKRWSLPNYTNNYDYKPMDIDQDGYIDLVTLNDGEVVDQKMWIRKEHILLNKKGEEEHEFLDYTSELWPPEANIGEDDNNIAFLDYDSDGDADFLIGSLSGKDRLLINDGKGHLTLAQDVFVGEKTPGSLSTVFVDLNKDGKLDVVQGQGEHKIALDERIFMGTGIKKDSAPPIISHVKKEERADGKTYIMARIHDNKSPSLLHDWKSISLIYKEGKKEQKILMKWYGEYLWVAEIGEKEKNTPLKIEAIDATGNRAIKNIE